MKLNGIAGKGVGKAGEMVFSVFRGEQVVRWMPQTVKNPNTARQQLSRSKFKLAVDLSRILNDALAVGYSGVKTQTLSARNEFVKRVIPVSAGVITGNTPETVVYNTALLKMSRGNLPLPGFSVPLSQEASTIEVEIVDVPTIPSQYGPGEYGVVFVALNNELGKAVVLQVKATNNVVAKIAVPFDWSGMSVNVFAFGKVIPEAKNGIPSATEPWMYPSEASDTFFCGIVQVI